MKNAICLICNKPNIIWFQFLSTFQHYDIYVIIDDNDHDYEYFSKTFPSINFIQIKNEHCVCDGFSNLNFIALRKQVSGWEKALYYFAHIMKNYEYIWFMEDDVYFYDENTLATIDKKYENIDLLCNSSFEEANLHEWLWHMIQINFDPPYFCGMMCIVRFSHEMMQSIKDYATKYNTLCFLEACYPTIAVKYNLTYIKSPEEFLSVTHRDSHNIDALNKNYLYHPVKNINQHIEARNRC